MIQRASSIVQERPAVIMRKIFFIPLIIIVATSCLYSGMLWGGFIRDDFPVITENNWITSARYIPEIFTSELWGFYQGDFVTGPTNYYRPLMIMVYMGGYSLFGPEPAGYHLINLLFHNLNSILVFLIAFSILNREATGLALAKTQDAATRAALALFAALVFAVHPVNVEAVAWVSAVSELSYAFFCLLSFYLYIQEGLAPSKARALYVLSVASYVFALFSKETAVVFPALIITYDLFFRKPAVKRYVPFVLAVAAFLIIRSRIVGSLTPEHSIGAYGYLLAASSVALQYFEKFIYPFSLKVYFPFQWPDSLPELFTREALFSLILAALLLFSIYRSSSRRTVLLSLVWGVIFISPAIMMIKYIHGECAFAGRYLYLSTAGFALISAVWLKDACGTNPGARKRIIAAIGIGMLAVFAANTFASTRAWKDEFSYWGRAAYDAPESPMARANFGFALSEKGLYKEAAAEYEAALALIPEGGGKYMKPGGIYLNLGVIYYNAGETDKALAVFNKAMQLIENDGVRRELHARVGRIYLAKGMNSEAVPHLLEAVSGNGPQADTYNMLGIAYARDGHIDKASAAFRSALAIDPAHAEALKNMARLRQ